MSLSLDELRHLLILLNEQRVTSFEHNGFKVTLIPSGPVLVDTPPRKTPQEDEEEAMYWSAG